MTLKEKSELHLLSLMNFSKMLYMETLESTPTIMDSA